MGLDTDPQTQENPRILLDLSENDGTETLKKKGKGAKKPSPAPEKKARVGIPLALISKANLEPIFEFDEGESDL